MAKSKKGVVSKKKTSKKYNLYDSGKKKNKSCPKCGLGVFLAKHKNRSHCGNCGYTEFNQN